jgi:GAF domain-containing protein
MLKKAVHICDAKFGTMHLYEEGKLRLVAAVNVPATFEEVRRDKPLTPAPGGIFDQVIKSRTTVHLPDPAATKLYADRHPRIIEAVELGGIRTVVAVPMFKENTLIGMINIHRREVRPFTDEQIALVTNFAAQAVIAIENARLFNELRQRTAELTESLEQQTATSEVLQVISSTPGDLQPVFDSMLEKAVRICEAKFGNLWLREGDLFRVVAVYGAPAAYREMLLRAAIRPGLDTGLGMLLKTKRFVQIDDITKGKAYLERDPLRVATVELGGGRTLAEVPLLKNGELIGSINIYHQEVKPFTEKQIELLTNFATQAVIAIENTRLLNELRESLQEQTATSEVLQVISSSLGDLGPVFESMLERAVRICDAKFGNIYRWGRRRPAPHGLVQYTCGVCRGARAFTEPP